MKKKYIAWPIVAFALFYLLTQPSNAADAVKNVAAGVAAAAEALSKFVNALG